MTKFTKFAVAAAFAFGIFSIASAATVVVPPTLMVGSTGTQVMNVQTNLGITADGSYGPATQAAVMAFQSSHALTADGKVGPMTAAALNAMGATTGTYPAGCTSNSGFSITTGESCAATTTTMPAGCVAGAMFSATTGEACTGGTTPSTPTTLGNDEGEFDSFDKNSIDEDSIEADEEDAVVLAFEGDVQGDLSVDRVDVYAEANPAGAHSTDLEDYFTSFSLMLDGEVVSEVDMEDADEEDYDVLGLYTANDEFRIRFENIDTAFEDGDKPEFEVAVNTNSGIDGDDEGETWIFGLADDSVRFTDGTGFTDEDGDDSIDESITIDAEGDEDEFTVSDSDEDPDSTTLQVEDNAKSDWYTIHAAEFEVDEDSSDINLKEFRFTLDTGTANVEDVIDELEVKIDGESFDDWDYVSGAASTLAVVKFDIEDEDVMIDADDMVTVEIMARFTAANGVNYNNGETIIASFTTANVDAFDAEGKDDLDSTKLKGSSEGEQHTLITQGLTEDFDSKSASTQSVGADDTIGKFTFEFELSAFEDTFYISEDGSDFAFDLDLDDDMDLISVSITDTSADETTDGTYRISDGSSESFTVEVQVEAATLDASQSARVQLLSVDFNDASDLTGTSDTLDFDVTDYKSATLTVFNAS